jgi:hypothetical protein
MSLSPVTCRSMVYQVLMAKSWAGSRCGSDPGACRCCRGASPGCPAGCAGSDRGRWRRHPSVHRGRHSRRAASPSRGHARERLCCQILHLHIVRRGIGVAVELDIPGFFIVEITGIARINQGVTVSGAGLGPATSVCRVSEASASLGDKLITKDPVAGIAPAQQEDVVDIVGKLVGCLPVPVASQ